MEDGLDAVDVNREASVGGGGAAADDVEDEEFNVEEADDPTNDRTNE